MSLWLEQRLKDDYVNRSCRVGGVFNVVLVWVKIFDVTNSSIFQARLTPVGEILPFLFVFRYAPNFNDCLDAQYFTLNSRLYWHNFHMLDRCTVFLSTLGAWVRRSYTGTNAERRGIAVVATAQILRLYE